MPQVGPDRFARSSRSACLLSLLLGAAPFAAPASAQDGRVTLDRKPGEYIGRTTPIALRASVTLAPDERLAFFVADTDVSALLRPSRDGWILNAALLPHRSGEHEVVAYLVSGDSLWQLALRDTIRVAGTLGVASTRLTPTLDVGLASRLASEFEPASPSERDRYHDVDGQIGIESELQHRIGGRLSTRAQFVGHSEQNRALRFGELQQDAPRIDLSSYVVQNTRGPLQVALGHITAGAAPHLIQGFTSRGASVALAHGERMQLAVSALHGSSVAGYGTLLGLGEPDHRVLTGSVALEALPTAGALRLELTGLDGSVLPFSGFNAGAVTDAETSTGLAVRVQSQLLAGRMRVEGGYTRSSFNNPFDPLLAQDTVLVDVERETRGARYLQSSVDLLRGARIAGPIAARLTLGYAHEHIEPLFRTVTARPQADQARHRWELRGDVSGVGLSVTHGRSRNNLDELPSILTTHLRQTGLEMSAPLPSFLGNRTWVPTLRWRGERTHQFGVGIPVNGGFAESHVPDQVSLSHALTADLRLGFAAIAYRHDVSTQDNRQEGREEADFDRTLDGLGVRLTPLQSVSLGIDLSWQTAIARETDETDRTRTAGVDLNWTPFSEGALGVQLSTTRAANPARASERDDRHWTVQWLSPVPGLRRFGGRWVLRFARLASSARESDVFADRRAQWTVDSSVNLSFR